MKPQRLSGQCLTAFVILPDKRNHSPADALFVFSIAFQTMGKHLLFFMDAHGKQNGIGEHEEKSGKRSQHQRHGEEDEHNRSIHGMTHNAAIKTHSLGNCDQPNRKSSPASANISRIRMPLRATTHIWDRSFSRILIRFSSSLGAFAASTIPIAAMGISRIASISQAFG